MDTVINIDNFLSVFIPIDDKNPILLQKWEKIANRLGTPAGIIRTIKEDKLMHDINAMEIYLRIFRHWCSTKGDAATVGRILDVLESEEMHNSADKLKEKFGINVNPRLGGSAGSTSGYSSYAGSSSGSAGEPPEPNGFLPPDSDGEEDDIEKKQKLHIQKNMTSLIRLTELNPSVLTLLMEKNMLNYMDIDVLNSTHNRTEKNKKFYQIISSRKNSYSKLIDTLEATRQTGAVEILKMNKNDF